MVKQIVLIYCRGTFHIKKECHTKVLGVAKVTIVTRMAEGIG